LLEVVAPAIEEPSLIIGGGYALGETRQIEVKISERVLNGLPLWRVGGSARFTSR
jgi:hypothetical protein